ncbi:MAG: hypothetical protein HY754_01810 [Nitrospirae bacterium]|nr:hypothetical protein [Nitrospirota bacterium]
MNKKQRENLAKYSYDLSKIMVTAPLLGNLLSDKFSIYAFWFGLISAFIFLIVGYVLDKKEETE